MDQHMNKYKLKVVSLTCLLLGAFTVNAADYNDVYVFGDSLSDIGNLKQLDPSVPERFTNGPVAVEIIAGGLGFALTPSSHLTAPFPTGTNFAIAGAKAVDEDGNELTPDINLPTQVNAFLQSKAGVAPADALYIVMIGGNDIRAAREIGSAGVLASTFGEKWAANRAARASISTAVASQVAQVQKLVNAGAKDILVINAPNVGAIPETDIVTAEIKDAATYYFQKIEASFIPAATKILSKKYNYQLSQQLNSLDGAFDVNIIEFNLFGFLSGEINNAQQIGYTNTDDACIFIFSQGGAINPECTDFPFASGFIFWDEIHPTTTAHQRAGQAVLEMLIGN